VTFVYWHTWQKDAISHEIIFRVRKLKTEASFNDTVKLLDLENPLFDARIPILFMLLGWSPNMVKIG